MMAAIFAARTARESGCPAEVTLLEQNEKLGKKLYITGKGRCNLTNAADMSEFQAQVVSNPRFLYSAFAALSNKEVMEMVEKAGCPLKVERGNRVFPVSDKSSDVIKAFSAMLKEAGVDVRLGVKVTGICCGSDREKTEEAASAQENGSNGQKPDFPGRMITGVETQSAGKKQALPCDALIVCGGGLSYPVTGSDGSCFALLKKLGHTVTPCRPALVSLSTKETWPADIAGLTLKNVKIRIGEGKRALYEDFGELLFTHTGVSGPTILSASSVVGKKLQERGALPLFIDLKPALSEEVLDARLLRDFAEEKNRRFRNSLGGLLPASLAEVIVRLSGINPDKQVNEITAQERRALLALLKAVPLTINGSGGYHEAIITQGGVPVKEIQANTMESKLVRGLYLAGEMLDVDALTGGFNLQIAWSTGALAGRSAAL